MGSRGVIWKTDQCNEKCQADRNSCRRKRTLEGQVGSSGLLKKGGKRGREREEREGEGRERGNRERGGEGERGKRGRGEGESEREER